MPIEHRDTDTENCAQHIADRVGPDLRMAAPLGLGKPHGLFNALYRLTANDKTRSMRLHTALSLARPQPKPGLEARFLTPFLERHFGIDQVDPQYALPSNVEVQEFYMQSGALLHSGSAPRRYISQNYTMSRAISPCRTSTCWCNWWRDAKDPMACITACRATLIHPELPYMSGMAEVAESFFDIELRTELSSRLFALPRLPVGTAEYALGLHASALVTDGGCLQIGIGALSDALVKGLLLRQQENGAWRDALAALDTTGNTQALAERLGGSGPFEQGRYGASEMVLDGFMNLQRAGVLKRRSWDNLALELTSAAGRLNAATPGGHYLRGAFFLGTRELYEWRAATEAVDPEAIDMCPVSNVNHLYGDHQALATLQRRGARFFNTCMMATLLGAAVSETLDDGSVVGGVGGQYNFATMGTSCRAVVRRCFCAPPAMCTAASRAISAGTTDTRPSRGICAICTSPNTASPICVARATANASRRCCRSATRAFSMRYVRRRNPTASWRRIS